MQRNLKVFLKCLGNTLTRQLPMGVGNCQWSGLTDQNICNIHGVAHLASRYRAMLRLWDFYTFWILASYTGNLPHWETYQEEASGSYHFVLGGGAVCLWGDQIFFGQSKGGANFFPMTQRGGGRFFLGVQEGGPNFFSKSRSRFFGSFGAILQYVI